MNRSNFSLNPGDKPGAMRGNAGVRVELTCGHETSVSSLEVVGVKCIGCQGQVRLVVRKVDE